MAKEALEVAKSCHLFCTVPMQATGIQYHVDIAQTIIQVAKSFEHKLS